MVVCWSYAELADCYAAVYPHQEGSAKNSYVGYASVFVHLLVKLLPQRRPKS